MTLPPGVGLEPLFDFTVVLLAVAWIEQMAVRLGHPPIRPRWNNPVDNRESTEGATP